MKNKVVRFAVAQISNDSATGCRATGEVPYLPSPISSVQAEKYLNLPFSKWPHQWSSVTPSPCVMRTVPYLTSKSSVPLSRSKQSFSRRDAVLDRFRLQIINRERMISKTTQLYGWLIDPKEKRERDGERERGDSDQLSVVYTVDIRCTVRIDILHSDRSSRNS